MPGSILGLNMRVTGHYDQGGRKYMEDVFSVAYQQSEDGEELEYAFIGIFDGHGGKDAALFAKEKLMDNISKSPNFWSESDDLILKAIREGFIKTQKEMQADLVNWPKTSSGMASTAGTTASIAFIRRGKLYVGHVGDSGIILGEQCPNNPNEWRATRLTRDHKPECPIELARIEKSGGKVVNKSGVPRVVWTRPSKGHTGPIRRSTHIDEVPFLAVARALGDLWSYNSKKDEYVVSPDPDLHVYDLDITKHRCLIFGTDGAWNVLSPEVAVSHVRHIEKNNEKYMLDPEAGHTWKNPAKTLVDSALNRWRTYELRADNTTTVVVLLDPPGPPRAQVLKRQRQLAQGIVPKKPCNNSDAPPLPPKPNSKGISVISRFPNSSDKSAVVGRNLMSKKIEATSDDDTGSNSNSSATRIIHDSISNEPKKIVVGDSVQSPAQQKNKSNNVVQINEVTSSDTENDKTPAEKSRPQGSPKLQAGRKSLSRELASLNLDSPCPTTAPATTSSRSRRSTQAGVATPSAEDKLKQKRLRNGRRSIEGLGHEDDSDAENNDCGVEKSGAGAGEDMVPASKLAEVEKKCEALTQKLKEMEAKVTQKTDKLAQDVLNIKKSNIKPLTATKSEPLTPSRVLRSKNVNSPGPSTSAVKRKLSEVKGEKEKPSALLPFKRERRMDAVSKSVEKPKAPAVTSRTTRRSTGSSVNKPLFGTKLRRRKIY